MATEPSDRPARTVSLAELDEATGRFVTAVRGLSQVGLSAPSALPGWSRGHVVAHVARNADALANLAEWAATGVKTPMYLSKEAKFAAIETDGVRPLEDQLVDLEATAQRLSVRLTELPHAADEAVLKMITGAEVEGWELPLLRIREVEIHHVDLALDYDVQSWTDEFSVRTLDQVSPGFAARGDVPFARLVAAGGRSWTVGPGLDSLTGRLPKLLGWLLGRGDGAGLRPEGRTDIPPAPPWS